MADTVPPASPPTARTPTKRRRPGRPRKGSSKSSGATQGSSGANPLGSFVRGADRARLLEAAEEIKLCKRLQRLSALRELRDELREAAGAARAASWGSMAPEAVTGVARPTAVARTHAHEHEGAAPPTETTGLLVSPAALAAAEEEVAQSSQFDDEAAWARTAGLTVDELRVAIRQGREAEHRIVESNLGLVGAAVGNLKRGSGGQLDSGTTESDLMQEGCLALLKAAQNFDVTRGFRFSTYATFWVRAAISRTLQEQTRTIRLPSRLQSTYAKIKRASRELVSESYGVQPTDADVAQKLGNIGADKVRKVVEQVEARTSSLDAQVGDEGTTRADFVEDERQDPEAAVVDTMLRADVSRLLERFLTADEARVLSLRFGLQDGEPRTMREVGEEAGLTSSQAKHLVLNGLTKLRKPHVSYLVRDYVGGL